MLGYQTEVELCIIHFVALEVILELSKLYLEALNEPELKHILHQHYEVPIKGKDIKFRERPFIHQMFRVLYKVWRCLYVSIFFYFIPFFVYLVEFLVARIDEFKETGE